MPQDDTVNELLGMLGRLTDLDESARKFVAPDRGLAIIRKWLPREPEGRDDDQVVAMAADALMLSADLLIGQPTASGCRARHAARNARPV